ncbi:MULTISPECIES: PPC domain-containing protein [unclassified Leptolyngbya]|uniref:PPC domain-containing protein n=1 Tax=unclassified Leptolyngbya TaxID=2650499 RepID=UPI0016833D81|nr:MULTISPECIES: PPC domain-containing protein [unclassified Leptolyngbya]MBD1913552.1 PPC domain-containing protein [Leptolyngbya sp. FACHB-8]MBD2155877.1 PPC domain-containing protein [Leptolyngbya sp. FACHB-16]
MSQSVVRAVRGPLILLGTALTLALTAVDAHAQRSPVYNPLPLPSNNQVTDTLSTEDIPTGSGGFARDYLVSFEEGDQVVMDLTSDQFDTILTLIAPDGTAIGQNDDGPDGSTNSLLFARITQPGNYIVRVSPFGGQGQGEFTLNVNRLRSADEPCR